MEDNLRRFELGLLVPPEGADLPTFLLSDGATSRRPSLPSLRTLRELFDTYFVAIPATAIEPSTLAGVRIHAAHLERLLGPSFGIQALQALHLQDYITRRSRDPGIYGRRVSASTIKKEIVTLRSVWNWHVQMGNFTRPFPNRGLKYPKLHEKPPFQTFDEVLARIEWGGLTLAEKADLWDCVFLTLDDLSELLAQVAKAARQRFIYPMFAFAAHTGARRSEMIRAEIDDVDFATTSVSLRERKRVKGVHSRRRVPLSPLLRQVLQQWLDVHPGGVYLFSQDPHATREGNGSSTLLTRDKTHDHFVRTLAGSKWQHLRGWHVLRHSFCSNLAANGVDQRLINAWVGHQSEEMVTRYRHLIPSHEQEALASVFG